MKGERIKIVDSPCGWGKSSYAIQYINSLPDDVKVIYITPFLSETERIAKECPSRQFHEPQSMGRQTKTMDLIRLIEEGENISSTHALFKGIGKSIISLLKAKNYILILDEVMNVVEKLDIYEDDRVGSLDKDELTKKDINLLIERKMMNVKEDGLVKWVSKDKVLYKYKYLKELADRDMLYYVGGDFLIWTFPIDVFKPGIFKEIYILTYQFDCQIQAYYYDFFNLEYKIYRVLKKKSGQYYLVEADELGENYDVEWKRQVKSRINICKLPKINSIGDYYNDSLGRTQKSALSKSWYESDGNSDKVRKSVSNFFANISVFDKASERMWTCFKCDEDKIKSSKASLKNWISCNCRASNDYADKRALAYPINRYLNPYYENFFIKRGINIDQDRYAVSEMIQWVFRSAIRKGKKIDLYVPSQRMRELFERWLGGEIK